MTTIDDIIRPADPQPPLIKCPLCDEVGEWRMEIIRHIQVDHPGVCWYCFKKIGKQDSHVTSGALTDRIEHMVSEHAEYCPLCEVSDRFNFTTKILHLRQWHKSDPVMKAWGVSVYLR